MTDNGDVERQAALMRWQDKERCDACLIAAICFAMLIVFSASDIGAMFFGLPPVLVAQ